MPASDSFSPTTPISAPSADPVPLPGPNGITAVLQRCNAGDDLAIDELFRLVYDDFKVMALAQMRAERTGHTLQATGVVHEAYFKLLRSLRPDRPLENTGHFFGSAKEAIRQVLIDYARYRNARVRKATVPVVPIDAAADPIESRNLMSSGIDLEALRDALAVLEREDARLADVVHLHYYHNLSDRGIGEDMGLSRHQVYRMRQKACERLNRLIKARAVLRKP